VLAAKGGGQNLAQSTLRHTLADHPVRSSQPLFVDQCSTDQTTRGTCHWDNTVIVIHGFAEDAAFMLPIQVISSTRRISPKKHAILECAGINTVCISRYPPMHSFQTTKKGCCCDDAAASRLRVNPCSSWALIKSTRLVS
jgi:hypothetical protein